MKLAGFQRGEGGWSSEGSAVGGRDQDSQIVFSLSLSQIFFGLFCLDLDVMGNFV